MARNSPFQQIPYMWALSNLKILGRGLGINVPTEATGSTESDGATERLLRLGTGTSSDGHTMLSFRKVR